jgi:DNA replication and repair protein RecF
LATDRTSQDGPPLSRGILRATITRLTVTNFRCYDQARLDLDPRPVVLAGANGAGKTNLLEALSLLSPGRGLRGAKLAELARIGSDAPWGVAATLVRGDETHELGTGSDPAGSDRRLIRIDGEAARATDLGEQVAMLWLTPQMDRLFGEGASARRRFFDRLVLGLDPAHGTRSNRYERALRQRARLLQEGRPDPAWLDGLEREMAETGVAIAAARRAYLERLVAALALGNDAFPRPAIAVSGPVEEMLGQASALQAEDEFRRRLAASRGADTAAGGTALLGPHKSDVVVVHAVKDMLAERCSTGEQKALLISLILAASLLTGAERGATPVLLLDEVAAHLDPDRRLALYGALEALGGQFWLTGTEPGPFQPLAEKAQFFDVRDASVRRV